MKDINIVIEKIYAGLETEYNTFTDLSIVRHLIKDERHINDIIPRCNFYTFEQDQKFKVYSFYDTTVIDREKRQGYAGVKLFISADKEIKNVVELLQKIYQKFSRYVETRTNCENQNYSEILEIAEVSKPSEIIHASLQTATYYDLLDESNTITNAFNKLELNFVRKSYFFDRSKARLDAIKSNDLLPIDTVSTRKITVDNTVNNLREIRANDNQLSIPRGESIFTIVCSPSDIITYSEGGYGAPLIAPSLNTIKVNPKKEIAKEKETNNNNTNSGGFSASINSNSNSETNESNPKKKSRRKALLLVLGGFVLGASITGGIGSYFYHKEKNKPQIDISQASIEEIVTPGNYFQIDSITKKVALVANLPELGKYKFKYDFDIKTWKYMKDGGENKVLSNEIFLKILKDENVKADPNKILEELHRLIPDQMPFRSEIVQDDFIEVQSQNNSEPAKSAEPTSAQSQQKMSLKNAPTGANTGENSKDKKKQENNKQTPRSTDPVGQVADIAGGK